MNAGWCIEETGKPDAAAVDRLGNAFLLGNGYLGYRGTLEEYGRAQKTATIVSGLYDKAGSGWREPVNAPNGLFVQVLCDGEPLSAAPGAVSSRVLAHAHTLDMQRAVLSRSTSLETAAGSRITLRSQRFVSLSRLHMVCLRYSVESVRDCDVVVRAAVDADVWDLNGPHLRDIRAESLCGVGSITALTSEKGIPLAVSELSVGQAQWELRDEGNRCIREAAVHLRPGQAFSFDRLVSVNTGLEDGDPGAAGRAGCLAAAAAGYDRLLADHRALWAERWESADVRIHGDAEAQAALRFSMYHVLSVAPTHSDRVSIPARGLSSQVYKGGVFWDTEIFMLPFLVAVLPGVARKVLMYRCHTLDGARRKAREYGRRGAFYAWESQETGDDACTLFNVTDVITGRPLRTYFRDKQYHISADVVFALWHYWVMTGDASLFLDGGAEVIFECARFYLSLVYYNPTLDRYELLDVTGPDEYHERVHNNAFTNTIAAFTLDVCCQVHDLLAKTHSPELESIAGRLSFIGDLAAIRQVRAKLHVPAPDPRTGLVEQFDGYFGLEDTRPSALLQRKLHPDEYLGGGSGLATQTQVIKQADVVLAAWLFDGSFSPAVSEANWRYYEPRTEHGSSLSACAYGIVGARIGEISRAYDYFMETATVDLAGTSRRYVGTLYIDGTHSAANAAAWDIVVAGFCGLHVDEAGISLHPRLPAHWEEVIVPIAFRGWRLVIAVRRDAVVVRSGGGAEAPVIVIEAGGRRHTFRGKDILIPLPADH
jgi:nigerose phosphorylase